jgi:hypothetical protein
MKKRLCLTLCLLAICLPLFAGVNGHKAVYVGGTVSGLKQDTEGSFSTQDEKQLVFQPKEIAFTIPYNQITSLEYGRKAGRRVAMAMAISPILMLSKKRHHYLTINFTDAGNKQQAAVFELGKNIVSVTLSSLEAHTGCKVEYQEGESANTSTSN